MDERLASVGAFVEKWGGIGPLFCIFPGALLTAVALLWMSVHWVSAPGWATVEGRVVSAGVSSSNYTVRRSSGSGTRSETRYSADIAYAYNVGGRDYTGRGIGDGEDWNYFSYESAADAVARYNRPVLTVYYDPADPGRSALDTNIFGIVPWILGGTGLPLLGFGLWLRRSRLAATRDVG